MIKKIFMALLILFSTTSLVACKNGAQVKAELTDFEHESYIGLYGASTNLLTKYIGTHKSFKVPSGVAITRETFSFNEDIEMIVLKDVVIPAYAFEGCTNLRVVKAKNCSIGEYAFKGCENLEEVHFNLNTVESNAFLDCHKLKRVVKFGSSAYGTFAKDDSYFYSYTSTYGSTGNVILGINSIPMDEEVYKINSYAYYGRDLLKNVTISSTIKEIGTNAFGATRNLERISVDKANKTLDSRDNSNAIIETNTNTLLVGCKNTIIPSDIQSIAANAFVECDVTGVNIPTGVKSISNQAYVGCTGISNISVSVNNVTFDSRENCNAIIETNTNKLVLACNTTVLPSSVTTIGSYAYANSSLETLVIPNTVTTLEDYAFANMKNLKSITIPASITSLNDTMFEGCDNLETINIESGNPKYDSRANSNAIIETETDKLVYAIKTTTIPNSIKIIGAHAFEGHTNLTKIEIPESVTVIEDYAFADCSNVTSITIPDSITTIGEGAFMNLNKIEALKIPNSVTSIGEMAFAGWTSLVNILVDSTNPVYYTINSSEIVEKETGTLVLGCSHTIITEDIKNIKKYAFYGSKLKSLRIPATLTSFESGAFAGCRYLAEIFVADGNPTYKQGNNTVIEIATDKVVVGCANSIIDETVKIIGAHAFEDCDIKSISLPKGLLVIEQYAFANNSKLSYVSLPKTLTSVESYSFLNCHANIAVPNKISSALAENWR